MPTQEWEQDIKRTTSQNTWEAKGGDLQSSAAGEVLCEGDTDLQNTLALLNVVIFCCINSASIK